MTSWHSYPKINNLGHRAVADVTNHPCRVEEKVDGSQFSFGVFDGQLKFRSKGREFAAGEQDNLFNEGVEAVLRVETQLWPGWTYRAEYLKKPKHNTLEYARIPQNHIVLFDINREEEDYVTHDVICKEALRLGFDAVWLMHHGEVTLELLQGLLERESMFDGTKIEGVVLKPILPIYGPDGKAIMAKHVSEAFKEKHQGEWKKTNPQGKDILQVLGESLRTEARWTKAIQHLRDDGQLEHSPKDIGPLMKAVQGDVFSEEEDYIKEELYRWAKPHLKRQIGRGLPEWYKAKLMEEQFNE